MAKQRVLLVHDMRSLRELAQLPKQVAELEKRNLDVVLLSEFAFDSLSVANHTIWSFERVSGFDFVVVMDGLYQVYGFQSIISVLRYQRCEIMAYSAALANLPVAIRKQSLWDRIFGSPLLVSNEERAW